MPNQNAVPARVLLKYVFRNCPIPDKMFGTETVYSINKNINALSSLYNKINADKKIRRVKYGGAFFRKIINRDDIVFGLEF